MPKAVIVALTLGITLAGAAGTHFLGGASTGSSDTLSVERAAETKSQGIVATRGNISNVLSLDADLIARPRYQVLAPLEGVFSPMVHQGQEVDAGDVLGVVRGDGGDVKIAAKARAKVGKILASPREVVPSGIEVLELQDRGFSLQASVAPSDRYRLTALGSGNQVRASIDNGPGPFACPLLGGPQRGDDGSLRVLCSVPNDLKVFAGLKGIMAVSLEKRKNVLTLPISAVAGSALKGQVNLIGNDGQITTADVTLGITDGVRIEIRSGLSEGQLVSPQAPSLGAAGK